MNFFMVIFYGGGFDVRCVRKMTGKWGKAEFGEFWADVRESQLKPEQGPKSG